MASSSSSALSWSTVGQWAPTTSNSERDKRKKVLAPLVEQTLRRPHLLDAEDATIIALSAGHIIDIAEQDQVLAVAAVFAVGLRRSFTSPLVGAHIGDVISHVFPLAFTAGMTASKLRYHRRALAADYLASAVALYPAEFVRTVTAERFGAALGPLWQELTSNRQWAKRGFGTGKTEQEEAFEQTASYRCAVIAVADAVSEGTGQDLRERFMGCLDESGYKARDWSTTRTVLAVAADASCSERGAGLPSVANAVLNREVHLEPPEKGAQKTLYASGAPSSVLWTWDTRSVRYYAACLCRILNQDPANEAAHQQLTAVAASSTEEILLDVALVVATTLDPRAVWPELIGRLVERSIAAMLARSTAHTCAAIDVLRKLIVAFLRLVAVTTHNDTMFEATKSSFGRGAATWFRDLYGALRHLMSNYLSDNAVLSAGLVLWLEATLLQRTLDAVDDETVVEVLGEVTQVTSGRECAASCLCEFLDTLEFTCGASSPGRLQAVLATFRRPLLELFAEAVHNQDLVATNTAAGAPTMAFMVRRFFAVVDAPLAHIHANVENCFTLHGLTTVALKLDASDALLPRVAADCGAVASLWRELVGDTSSLASLGQADLRLRLFEAIAIAPTATRRVALSTTFAAL